jgi:hypothetical protein
MDLENKGHSQYMINYQVRGVAWTLDRSRHDSIMIFEQYDIIKLSDSYV